MAGAESLCFMPRFMPRFMRATWVTLAVTAGYYVLGKWCLLLGMPPLFASAVWLPAGLALAAAMLWGWRAAFGIWLGSALLHSDLAWTHFDDALRAVLLVAVTSFGALAQAYVTCFLIRRATGLPLALARVRDIFKFMALGAAGCLISASLAVAVMVPVHTVVWADAPFVWFTWWVGDTVGVFVMVPLLLIAFGRPRAFWRQRAWTVGLPLVAGVCVVMALFLMAKNRNRARDEAIFNKNAQLVAQVLRAKIATDPGSVPDVMALIDARKFAWQLRELPADGRLPSVWKGRVPRAMDGAEFHYDTVFGAGDSRWSFWVESTTTSYAGLDPTWQMWALPVGGNVLVSLLGAFLLVLTGRTSVIEAEVADRTARLSALNRDMEAEVANTLRAKAQVSALADELESRVADRTAQLEAARFEADLASRAKSAFLANMSHEVRTPMNGVLGLVEMLLATPLDARQRQWLRTVKDSGETLMHILDEVLDLSKIEAGNLKLEIAPFSLRKELAKTLDMLAARAEAKGLVLHHCVEDAVPDALEGDAFRLRQILLNLVGNAIKFTPHGSIEVRVKLAEASWVPSGGPSGGPSAAGNLCRLHLCVADTGVGIDPGQLKSIFKPFTQADASVTRRFGGSGLGLAICARLVKLMGGDIFAENRAGGGSVFHVRLVFKDAPASAKVSALAPAPAPAPVPAPVPVAPTWVQTAPPSVSPRRVLVVEDNRINQQVVENLLSARGHAITLASHGGEALEILAREEFDIILMDMQMPVMDGFEALRRLRGEEAATGRAHRRIVALTASAMRGDREICLAAGMDGYLAKPIQPKALYEAVEQGVVSDRAGA